MIGFEVVLASGINFLGNRDLRSAFVLWDPRGRPHSALPELVVDRLMTGREVLEVQTRLWESHVVNARRRFGRRPLAGPVPPDQAVRGLIAFTVDGMERFGHDRWMLELAESLQWYFSPEQILEGTRHPFPPSGERTN